jgi:methyltransferase FkbM-like protein
MKPANEFLAHVPAAFYSAFPGLGHVVSASAGDTLQVSAESLDDYVQTQPPDFLRCDVEAAEVLVFRGAQHLLKEKRPKIICEMHSAENQRNLLEEFSRFGYSCKPRGTNHILALPQ